DEGRDRPRRILDPLRQRSLLLGTECLEDPIRSVLAGVRRTTHPEAQARKLVPTEVLDDIAQALRAPSASTGANAQAPKRKIDVVGNNEQVRREISHGKQAYLFCHRGPREIHEGLRLE